MKFIQYILLSAGIMLFGQGFGQSPVLKKAEKLYAGYSYPESIEQFERVSDKTPEIKRKLAESYFYSGDYENAEKYYAELASSEEKTRDDVYQYAYVLEINQKYDEAKKQMSAYAKMAPDDSRAKRFSENPEYRNILLRDNQRFSIKNLVINGIHQEFGAHYLSDSTVVFASTREPITPVKRKWNWNDLPFLDLYIADVSEDNELSEVRKFHKDFNKKYHEGPVSFNANRDFMVYTRNNYTSQSSDEVIKLELYYSEFADGKWQEAQAFPYNDKEYSVGHAALSPDGTTMFFVSDMQGGQGETDIWLSRRNENNEWAEPENLGNIINTEGKEMFPFFHHSGYFFFASDGHLGLGGLDIFYSRYENGKFTKPVNLGVPVNSSYDDFALSADSAMGKGFFSSNRPSGSGDDDIYAFTMHRPFGIYIEGYAKDSKNNVLANTQVKLYNTEGQVLKTAETQEDGYYKFLAQADKKYSLTGDKTDYTQGINSLNTTGITKSARADVVLKKIPDISLRFLITEKESGEPVENAKITMKDTESNESIQFVTDQSGDYHNELEDKKINDMLSYNITIEKEGYLKKEAEYKKLIDKPGLYNVHEEIDITLTKIDVGLDLGKLVDLNPIYFDLNSHSIRPDAAAELDKIVKVMNEYPSMEIELGAHTDSRGSDSYNMKLSQRRANSSANYIKEQINNPERITGKGYGETQLVNKCDDGIPCSQEEHQENRRTEFKITKM